MVAQRAALMLVNASMACGVAVCQAGICAAQVSAAAGVCPSAMSQSAVQPVSIHAAPRVGQDQCRDDRVGG